MSYGECGRGLFADTVAEFDVSDSAGDPGMQTVELAIGVDGSVPSLAARLQMEVP